MSLARPPTTLHLPYLLALVKKVEKGGGGKEILNHESMILALGVVEKKEDLSSLARSINREQEEEEEEEEEEEDGTFHLASSP